MTRVSLRKITKRSEREHGRRGWLKSGGRGDLMFMGIHIERICKYVVLFLTTVLGGRFSHEAWENDFVTNNRHEFKGFLYEVE